MNARSLIRLACVGAALSFLSIPADAQTTPRPATLGPNDEYAQPATPRAPVRTPAGVCDDVYEPNQLCTAPNPPLLTSGVYAGLNITYFFDTFEADWYRVSVPAGMRLSVDLFFEHDDGDIQMALYPPDCSGILVNSLSTTDLEHCDWGDTGAGGEYRIVVENFGPGSCNGYTMRIAVLPCSDAFDPNETCAGPLTTLGAGTFFSLWIADYSTYFDLDWYTVFVRRGETLTATSTYQVAPANAEIGILPNDCSALVAYESSGGNTVHSVSWLNDGPDAFFKVGLDPYGDGGACHQYDLTIAISPTGNLDNTQTYAGWSAPVVPRNLSTGVPPAVITPTLDGNAASTWISWSIRETGPVALNFWFTELLLDGVPAVGLNSPDPAAPIDWYAGSLGPFTVRGGRHSLMSFTDRADLILETNEADNFYEVQHVWSPLVTAFETPNVRAVPPDDGFGPYPNSDGFAFSRNASVASVVSLAARNTNDDYDLYVYDDYSGSSAGFSNVISASAIVSNRTDFVVSHYSGTPITDYSAAIRYSAGTGGDFVMDQSDARFRNWTPETSPAHYLSQVMAANRLTDVYEALLTAGTTLHMSLDRNSGPSDLAFAVYPGTGGLVHSGYSGTPSSVVNSNHDVLFYTATVSGWHPVVVYRTDGTNANQPMNYDFHWNVMTVDVGEEPTAALELAFLGASPNPMAEAGRFDFVLPRAGDVTISLHDAQGRRLSEVRSTGLQAGRQTIAWDGRTMEGTKLAPGVYWATLQFEGRQMTKRIVRL